VLHHPIARTDGLSDQQRGEEIMKTGIRITLIVAACLFASALVVLTLIGGWAPISTAQIIDADECESACYAQESERTEACGAHTNPVECDGRCRDELEDCLRECR
jgi:hypothetical protein